MSDTKGPGNDPSMDDILASIRKIISDDEARAQVSGTESPPPKPSEPGPASAPPPPAMRDDVLLLTDLVDEPKTAPSPPKPTLVPPPTRWIQASAAQTPKPSNAPVPSSVIPLPPPTAPVHQPAVPPPSISAATPAALWSLPWSNLPLIRSLRGTWRCRSCRVRLRPAKPGRAGIGTAAAGDRSRPEPGPEWRGNLEDIVKELLRPMLKEWLDKNLPTMVERFRRTRDRPADPPLTPGAPVGIHQRHGANPWRFSF